MRIHDLFAAPLREGRDDARHQEALKQTGFWGLQGAGCLFLARDTGRFLIAHRSRHVQQPGTWGTWGGAIDDGEAPIAAVRREAEEETGQRLNPLGVTPLLVFQQNAFRYHNFLVMVAEEFTPVLDWETQGYRWCDWGRWPQPLHFGLKALLDDAASVHAMRAAAADPDSDTTPAT